MLLSIDTWKCLSIVSGVVMSIGSHQSMASNGSMVLFLVFSGLSIFFVVYLDLK